MSFPRYPKYKDSGTEWLGEVPEHWSSSSVRWLCRRYSGGTPDKSKTEYWQDGSVPWLNSGAVNDRLVTEPSELITEQAFANSSAKWIPRGALLIALAGQGKTKGMVAQLAFEATCNQSMAAIVPGPRIASRFLYWWLDVNYRNIRNMAGGDLRDGLNLELIGDIQCPLPSPPEQSAIASFLDRETAKIDALIAEQQRLIELLKEKRQAVISHAVTKGLNADAPMKDSGIEWLGEVPENWKVRKLRTLAAVVRGSSPRPAGDPTLFDGDFIPWVTVAEITKDESKWLAETSTYLTELGANSSRCFEPHTLLYSNSGATLGVPKILGIRACANDGVIGFLGLCDDADISFLYFFLYSITEAIREKVKQGSGQPNLNTDIVKDLAVALPPQSEQRAIVGFVEDACSQFDVLSGDAARAIALLQERRSALISAAVTGQIDVRGLAGSEAA